jgi:16S rRNA (guanine527-N7)-methyltransferase
MSEPSRTPDTPLLLDHATEQALHAFLDALYEANKVKNLTRVPREDAWTRHVLDSLLFQDLIPQGSAVLDIGTGPGLPAWPLALARPDLRVTALDSNGKMLDFLRAHPLPNLEVVQSRVEEWPRRERFDFVTGRALAPLPAQVELSAAPCKVGGIVVPMRTINDRLALDSLDLETLGLELREVVQRPLTEGEALRLFPVFVKIAKTKPQFPRRWPEIKAKPLVL